MPKHGKPGNIGEITKVKCAYCEHTFSNVSRFGDHDCGADLHKFATEKNKRKIEKRISKARINVRKSYFCQPEIYKCCHCESILNNLPEMNNHIAEHSTANSCESCVGLASYMFSVKLKAKLNLSLLLRKARSL